MNLRKIKRIFLAPIRYEAMRELFISANSKIVKLEETLKKAQDELLQKGVREYFLEEEMEELKNKNASLTAKIEQLSNDKGLSTLSVFAVVYDHFDTKEIVYLGLDEEKAENLYNENKLYDFYQYQNEKVIKFQTHREQGSALNNGEGR